MAGEGHRADGRGVAALLLALLAAAPAACECGASITVRQTGGMVRLAVTITGTGRPACLDDVALFADGAAAPLWHVAAFPDSPCRSALVLGRVPPRFAADDKTGPLRLEPGQLYRVEATGSGFIAATRFRAG